MQKILVTGGTVFVSQYVASYFAAKGDEVYVLNRNRRAQPSNTILIEADRHHLGNKLKTYRFDAVLDITAYTGEDVVSLLSGLGGFTEYLLISSSAVYPPGLTQPFHEDQPVGPNPYWGAYSLQKIAAEQALLTSVPTAYILRPPYLYGPMNNLYREAFAFECADLGRKFYLPGQGDMKLQFFYIDDLCRLIDAVLTKKPAAHILNAGNSQPISVRQWVELCYQAAGKRAEFVETAYPVNQRDFFSFYDYEYQLDVSRQAALLDKVTPMEAGLAESYRWYRGHKDEVNRKGYIEYIDQHFT